MSALGNLVVSLTAETAQFRSEMEKAAYVAQKNFNSIKRTAGDLVAGLGIYFSANMFMGWIKSSIDAADALYLMSQKVGIATDELSKLQYAAKLSDISTEDLGASLGKLNKNIAETARGTGEAQQAFKAMGINVLDSNGKIKATEQILLEIADKFSNYSDGANKAALAMALFGKAGANLIPFLNNGRAGIEAMGIELERLGGVIMPDAARRANEFNDNLDRLKIASNSLAIEIGNALIPTLTELTNEFLAAKKYGVSFMDFLGQEVRSPWETDAQAVNRLNEELLRLDKAGKGDSQEAKSKQRQLAYHHELATLKDYEEFQRKQAKSQLGGVDKTGDGLKSAPAIAGSSTRKSAAEDVTRILLKQTEAIQKLTLSERDLMIQEVIAAGGTQKQVEASTALVDTYMRLKKEQEERIQLDKDYKQLYEDTASPIQKVADEEARLLKLRENLIASGKDVVLVERMIDEARLNASEIMDVKPIKTDLDDLKDAAQQFSNAISTAFEDAIISGGNFQDMMKSLENTIIQIGTRILFTKPLERAMEGMFNNFMPGGSSSNWISSLFSGIGSLFGGGRASGGLVFPGQAYLVGERGPELFSPQMAGAITPNSQSSGISTTININVSGVSNSGDMRRSASQIASMAALAVARGNRNL